MSFNDVSGRLIYMYRFDELIAGLTQDPYGMLFNEPHGMPVRRDVKASQRLSLYQAM